MEGKGKNQRRIKGTEGGWEMPKFTRVLKNCISMVGSIVQPLLNHLEIEMKWGSKLAWPLFLHCGIIELTKDGAVA